MKKLLVYMRSYIKECILGPLFKLFEATLELIVPLVVAAIIDTGIGNRDTGYVVKMCLVLALLGVVGLLFSVTAQYFAARAAVGFVKKIRHALFSHIQRLSFAEIDSLGTSTMITRMTSDINQIQNGVNLTLRLFLRSPFVVFGAMIMAFTVDAESALVFVGVIPLLSAVVFGIMLICIPLYKKVQRCLDALLLKTRENLSGVRVIRAFCREEEEGEDFREKNDSFTAVSEYVGRISALMNPLTFVIINIAIVVLIHVGAIQVYEGVITQGALVALYNYMSQILVELIKLANLIISMTKAVACGNRVQEMLESESSVAEGTENPSAEGDYAVEFRNVSLRYGVNAEPSLENIDFKVKRGQTVGIIGGTGSGKTSVVNLISRFYDCTEGSVLVDGADVRRYTFDGLRGKVGMVPQKAVLFSGTIRENMCWGKSDATDDEILDALEIAQATDVVESKEGGLDSVVSQGGKNFSGGQRQRLTIARALVGRPEILILDDSASALDFATDASLRKALRENLADTTVFIVSQRTSSIAHADLILVLDDGKITGMGAHEELLEGCELYREIYNSQF